MCWNAVSAREPAPSSERTRSSLFCVYPPVWNNPSAILGLDIWNRNKKCFILTRRVGLELFIALINRKAEKGARLRRLGYEPYVCVFCTQFFSPSTSIALNATRN